MRIFIVADIEGVAGVVHPEQTRPGSPGYDDACRWLTLEVNAAVQGAIDGGATEVWVADAHAGFRNILFESLHPEARLLSGKPRAGGMLADFYRHGPWHGVFLLGCHARAGAAGVLAHTINSGAFASVMVEGKTVGEAFLNSAIAGEYSIPVRLVSGDDCVAREVASFLAGAEVVTVKQALANRAAVHLPAVSVHEVLREAAAHAVMRDVAAHVLSGSLWVEVTTVLPAQADLFAMLPGTERVHPTIVGFEAESASGIMRVLNVFSAMAASL